MEAVGVAQELFHSVKTKSMVVGALQIDLNKAYDRVSWGFLKLILIQVGIPFRMMKWIMSCVSSVSYAVLINGKPTEFFKADQGLRQGRPLSPLIFLLVIKGLSRMINKSNSSGEIKGIKISSNLSITHLMFLDDIMIVGSGSLAEWRIHANSTKSFSHASGLSVNYNKS